MLDRGERVGTSEHSLEVMVGMKEEERERRKHEDHVSV
jgi:hypothetical protein